MSLSLESLPIYTPVLCPTFSTLRQLTEECPGADSAAPFRVRLCPYYNCDPPGLESAYQVECAYQVVGIVTWPSCAGDPSGL